MRILFASLVAMAAVAIAAPAFAQEAAPATPTPTTKSKAKPGTAAYCSTLKSDTSKAACLKRVHAQATPAATPTTKPHKTKKGAAKPTDTAQLSPPTLANPVPATPAPATPSQPQTIAVPPLPQKTI
jgi:hypothetical protein